MALSSSTFRRGLLVRAAPYAGAPDRRRLRRVRGSTPNARFRVVNRKEILFFHAPSWGALLFWQQLHPALKGRLVHEGNGWKLEVRLARVWLAPVCLLTAFQLGMLTLMGMRLGFNVSVFRSFPWLVELERQRARATPNKPTWRGAFATTAARWP